MERAAHARDRGMRTGELRARCVNSRIRRAPFYGTRHKPCMRRCAAVLAPARLRLVMMDACTANEHVYRDDHEYHERHELDHGATIVAHGIGLLVWKLGLALDLRFSLVANCASELLLARADHVLDACDELEFLALRTARVRRRRSVLEAELGRMESVRGRGSGRADVHHAWSSMVELERPSWAQFWLPALLEQFGQIGFVRVRILMLGPS